MRDATETLFGSIQQPARVGQVVLFGAGDLRILPFMITRVSATNIIKGVIFDDDGDPPVSVLGDGETDLVFDDQAGDPGELTAGKWMFRA